MTAHITSAIFFITEDNHHTVILELDAAMMRTETATHKCSNQVVILINLQLRKI